MNIFNCPGSSSGGNETWNCFQSRYLGTIAPLAVAIISAAILLFHRVYKPRTTERGLGFEPIFLRQENTPLFQPQSEIRLSPSARWAEGVILLVDLAIGLQLITSGQPKLDQPAPIGSVILTVYLILLAYGRHRASRHVRPRFQLQSMSVYGAQSLCLLLIAYWTAVDSTSGRLKRIATVSRAVLNTTLLLLLSSAPRMPQHDDQLPESTHEFASDRFASLISSFLFSWMDGVIWKSIHEPLRSKDLFLVDYYRSANVIVREYAAATFMITSLLRGLFSFFFYDILIQGAWASLMSCTVFAPAILIRALLQHIVNGTLTRNTAWLCVAGLFISGIVTTVADTQAEWRGYKIGAKVRAILDSHIYRKVQIRGLGSMTESEDGNIVNLMAADTEHLCMMSANLHLAWIFFPVQLTIAIYLLYNIMGISGIMGVALMLISLPLNVLISKREVAAHAQVLTASDGRIQASNEVINTIRTIKYCAWEKPFRARVMAKRDEELRRLRTRFIWWSIAMTVFYSLPFLITISTCFFYTVVFGNEFGTVVAFPALAIFAVLRIPLNRLSDSISYLLSAYVSLARIETFLKQKETEKISYSQKDRSSSDVIRFENATLTWPLSNNEPEDSESDQASSESVSRFTLRDINIQFADGGLTLICGPTGSGKSSLLLAVLGEMKLLSGSISIPSDMDDIHRSESLPSNHIAYCAQEPWIFNQSIRANILFGESFSANRYKSVLSAVSLERDLAELDDGDQTLAGEGGNRLSGGQKQRVALARALYADSKLVVLDDCLSALDQRTASDVFHRAMRGPLMQVRTCIFATHNTTLAGPHCDYAVQLRDGRIHAEGTWDELVQSGLVDPGDATSTPGASHATGECETVDTTGSHGSKNSTRRVDTAASEEDALLETAAENDPALDYEEKSFEGQVPWSKVQIYLKSMGPWIFWILALAAFVGQQLVSLGLDLCIKAWARRYDEDTTADPARTSRLAMASLYLPIYGLVGLLYALVTFIRDAITFYGSLKASSGTYQRLLDSLLHARLTFFDRVPIGQIINRFASDVSVLDDSIATFSVSTLQLGISILITIGLIAVVFPVFLLPLVLIIVTYYAIMHLYVGASRDLRRIENIQKSPLYQFLSEAISGHITIRAYGQTARLQSEVNESIDGLSTPFLFQWGAKGWLTFRVGFLSSVIQCLTGAFVLWKADSIDPGNAGLAMTYAATLSEGVLWFIQVYAIVQQNLNSLERILEYTEIEQERFEPVQLSGIIPNSWPAKGSIEFVDYTTTYADDQSPVLKDINFKVNGGERLAIIGRTGAGKSSLTLALIRGLEAMSGKITIDGIDIATLPLSQLREVVTVVPQDPILFNGSIRVNLDPLQQYTNDEIYAGLRAVNFTIAHDGEEYSSEVAPLHSTLSFTASQLSRGQRQLLCIVRALLRNSRVVVLDEATASIDHATDQQIQAGLRASVARGTTVVAIAHRLQTIADYDRVVVLDGGRIVQQGSARDILGGKALRNLD